MATKLIEVTLPLDAINKEAAREKSIRHGHPSTLHLWWARRPLAACRAVLFAQLVDDPSVHPDRFPTEEAQAAERKRLFGIIERLVPWEASTDEKVLAEARAEIAACYPDGLPTIVDPFCGGGSIPLEAQRLGLPVEASDLNPVAVLITKALIELPPKFADRPPVHPSDGGRFPGTEVWKGAAGLADDVRWYARWIRDRAVERIGHLYPETALPDGSSARVIAWLWARTVACPNPACRGTMPLVRSFWLGKKKGKEAWVSPVVDPEAKGVRFEIGSGPEGPPVEGTVTRTGARCLVCDSPVPFDHVRAEGRAGRMGAQLMAIVAEGHRQRVYLPPDAVHEAAADVERPEDAPDSELPERALSFRVQTYGMTHHADLFTPRQLTALCTFSDLVREAHQQVLANSGGDQAYADAVATYLAFAVDKAADRNSSLSGWDSSTKMEAVRNTFSRQAMAMTWDFAEANPFASAAGSWQESAEWICKVLARGASGTSTEVRLLDATESQVENGVVSTDPPYYDNIGYADLADFFYVWLRRSLRGAYPELFATVLTPKSAELIATPYRFDGSRERAEKHFEEGFSRTFARIASEQHADTPLTVFYAFKQSEEDGDTDGSGAAAASTGWEKMLAGLFSSGLQVTATWPMRTELGNRMLSSGTNALASSIVLSCRPRPADAGVTDRRGFQQALKARLAHDLRILQSGGVAPVDLAQAAIGPGMAVFSRYAKVVEPDGSAMPVRRALALVNQVLDEVTAEQEGEFDEDTRWAIAWFAEYGVGEGPYGRADDLSRAKNVSVDGLVRAGIVKAGAGKVRLLTRTELDPAWDPATDRRLTVWEVTQHLIRTLLDEDERSAGHLLARVGGLGDAARDLSYRLYQVADAKKWAKEAGPYNALGSVWPELARVAAEGPPGQGSML